MCTAPFQMPIIFLHYHVHGEQSILYGARLSLYHLSHQGMCISSNDLIVDIIIMYDNYRWHDDRFPLAAGLDEWEPVMITLFDAKASSKYRISTFECKISDRISSDHGDPIFRDCDSLLKHLVFDHQHVSSAFNVITAISQIKFSGACTNGCSREHVPCCWRRKIKNEPVNIM